MDPVGRRPRRRLCEPLHPRDGLGTPEAIDTGTEPALDPQVAVDASGNAIAVWQQSNLFVRDIWASRYTAGVGWGTATLIETGAGEAGGARIAMDGAGDAIVVFCQQTPGGRIDVMSTRYVAGVGWGTAVAIEADDTGETTAPQVSVNASGDAVAVWGWGRSVGPAFEFSVWANRFTPGTGWGVAAPIDVVNPTTANPAPHVALDPAGNAIAVWHRDGGGWDSIFANRWVAGAGWGTAALVETDDTNAARGARVAVDASGNAIAVWTQNDGARNNVLASRYAAGSGWGAAEPIETDSAGPANEGEVRVVIDGDGDAIAVWTQRNLAAFTANIWTNRYTAGTGWGTAATIDADVNPAGGPQLGVDGSGRVVAVWQQSAGARYDIWAAAFR